MVFFKPVLYKDGKILKVGEYDQKSLDIDDSIPASIIPDGKYELGLTSGDVYGDKVPIKGFQTSNPLPVLKLDGDFATMTKDNKKTCAFSYWDNTGKKLYEGYAVTEWQGAGSLAYEKKNYSVKLYSDEATKVALPITFGSWYASNKFVLKANYVDATHARNIVSARLWKQIMSNPNLNGYYSGDELFKRLAANGQYGTVDGFPIEVEINGAQGGLYTLNLDNNTALVGIDEKADTKAMLFYAKGWGNVTQFWQADSKLDGSGGDFKLEYPDAVTPTHVQNVYNLIANTGIYGVDSFKSWWGSAYNIYELIDYILFMQLMNANDNLANNIGYYSLNGTMFYVLPYDMDGTWDLSSGGTWLNPHTGWMSSTAEMVNAQHAYPDIVVSRWKELKANVLNHDNIMKAFNDYKASLGDYGYQMDAKIWPNVPSRAISTYDQIEKAVTTGIAFMDSQMVDNKFLIPSDPG